MTKIRPKEQPNSRPHDGYNVLLTAMNQHANAVGGELNQCMYYVDTQKKLYDIILDRLPDEAKQHYTCNTCARFINKYGKLVTIDGDGKLHSVLFDIDIDIKSSGRLGIFEDAIEACKEIVENSKIVDVFKTNHAKLGTPWTGDWSHMHVSGVNTWRNVFTYIQGPQVNEIMCEYRESHNIMIGTLREFSMDVIDAAKKYINGNVLYRVDRVKHQFDYLYKIATCYNECNETKTDSRIRDNLIWKYVCESNPGLSHIKSSMLGTLLEDISKGLSSEQVISNFNTKMDPNNYMRTSAAPSQFLLDEAEKAITDMGYEYSLARQVASFDELPEDKFIWTSGIIKATTADEIIASIKATTKPEKKGGLFDSIRSKEEIREESTPKTKPVVDIPATVITWDKFRRTVMPEASQIYAAVGTSNNFVAMTTEQNTDSKSILKWDNPFAWSYESGADASIKRRVKEAGGKYEDAYVRASLSWEGPTDLDLYCMCPSDETVYFNNKYSQRFGAKLDVDANGGKVTSLYPVENIAFSKIPVGKLVFFVNNYYNRNTVPGVPFVLEIQVGQRVFRFEGIAGESGWTSRQIHIRIPSAEDLQSGISGECVTIAVPTSAFSGTINLISKTSAQTASKWNIVDKQFVRVNGIISSPNMWEGGQYSSNGNHTFFLLEDCKPVGANVYGFMSEMLNSDLLPYRRVLDRYVESQTLEIPEGQLACGLGFVDSREWNLTLRVDFLDGRETMFYKIDRFD